MITTKLRFQEFQSSFGNQIESYSKLYALQFAYKLSIPMLAGN